MSYDYLESNVYKYNATKCTKLTTHFLYETQKTTNKILAGSRGTVMFSEYRKRDILPPYLQK